MMNDELMTALIGGLMTILIGFISYASNALANYLKEKGLTDRLDKKKYLVDIAVNAIEQIYQNEEGSKKLQYAKNESLRLLSENGLKVTETELNAFLESAVKAMNDGFNSTKDEAIERIEGGSK